MTFYVNIFFYSANVPHAITHVSAQKLLISLNTKNTILNIIIKIIYVHFRGTTLKAQKEPHESQGIQRIQIIGKELPEIPNNSHLLIHQKSHKKCTSKFLITDKCLMRQHGTNNLAFCSLQIPQTLLFKYMCSCSI